MNIIRKARVKNFIISKETCVVNNKMKELCDKIIEVEPYKSLEIGYMWKMVDGPWFWLDEWLDFVNEPIDLSKVIIEIAKDTEVVLILEKAINRNDLMKVCPGKLNGRRLCDYLCYKVYPDLKNENVCPCNKMDRMEIANAIIVMSKIINPEKKQTFKRGDIFKINDRFYILAIHNVIDVSGLFAFLINLTTCIYDISIPVLDSENINEKQLKSIGCNDPEKMYVGNINNLSIMNDMIEKNK